MYLTLISGIFDKGRKTSLNMQVIVGIYDANGQLLKVCSQIKFIMKKCFSDGPLPIPLISLCLRGDF